MTPETTRHLIGHLRKMANDLERNVLNELTGQDEEPVLASMEFDPKLVTEVSEFVHEMARKFEGSDRTINSEIEFYCRVADWRVKDANNRIRTTEEQRELTAILARRRLTMEETLSDEGAHDYPPGTGW